MHGVGAAVGSTVRHLDKLRKSTEALQARTQRIAAYRALESTLATTQDRARRATERVARMGAAMRRIRQPSQEMRDALGKARAEANRLGQSVSRQSKRLAKARREMRRAGETVEDLDARERELNRTLARQRQQLERLGRLYAARDAARQRRADSRGGLADAAALGYSVFRPIIGATRAAIRFESVMADVRKVVDFDTPQQFAQMGEDVLKLSERIPVAASGIGDIVAAAGQAGIAREELTRFAEDAAKVAVAFDISGGEAGGRLTGLRSIFRANQDEVMRLAGAYNHLSNNMDATAPAMLNVAERSGSVAMQFGLTGEQTGALAATLLALKTPPEVAATGINALLVKLATAPEQSKGFQDALDALGMSAEGLKDDIERDAQGALLRFLETVDAADEKQSILFGLFGQEYVDDITKLAGGIDIYRDALRLSADQAAAATSIQDEYAARAATTENQIELLKNKTNALGVNIGSVLLPSVNDAVGVLGDLMSKGAALAAEFPGVTRVVFGLAGALVGLRVVAAVGGYAATFLGEGLATLRIGASRAAGRVAWLRHSLTGFSLRSIPTAIGSLNLLRLALIGTGIGAAVVAIGVGAALIMRYWEPIKAFFAGVASGIGEGLAPLGPMFGWVGDVVRWVGDAFMALAAPVDATAANLAGFRATGESVGRVIGTVFRTALLPVTALVKGVGTALKWLGVLDDTDVEAGVSAMEEQSERPGAASLGTGGGAQSRGRRLVRRGTLGAAAVAAVGGVAPAAATPVSDVPAFPAAPVAAATPESAVPAVDLAAIVAQVQTDLGGFGEGDAAGDAAFERIEAALAGLGRGHDAAVPAAVVGGVAPAAAAPVSDVSAFPVTPVDVATPESAVPAAVAAAVVAQVQADLRGFGEGGAAVPAAVVGGVAPAAAAPVSDVSAFPVTPVDVATPESAVPAAVAAAVVAQVQADLRGFGEGGAAVPAAVVGGVAPAAAAPVSDVSAFPVTPVDVATPESAVPAAVAAAVVAQVQADLRGFGEGGAAVPAAVAAVGGLGRGHDAAVPAAPPARLVFHQTFHFHGLGPEAEDDVARIMERIMRRAAVEAGHGAADDATTG